MYDQAAYLGETIDIYQAALEQGAVGALRHSLSGAWQHGFLVQHEAAFAYFLLGPKRLSAVTVSFLHLAGLQLLIVWLAVRVRRPLSGLALCGVLLSARTLMLEPGGLPDFRLDLAGGLLVTALGLLVVASKGFRLRRWSLAVGLLGGVACVTRMIVAPYLALGYAGWLVIALFLRNRPTVRPRLVNGLLAATVTGVLVLPFALAQFRALYGYYFVGVVTSDEKWLRAREFGIFTLTDHLTFYARSVLRDHAGWAFTLTSLGLLCLAGLRARGRTVDASAPEQVRRQGDAWWTVCFIVCVAAGAYAILTAAISKSPLVGNVFVGLTVPLLWLAIAGIRPEEGRRWEGSRWVAVGLTVIIAGGALTFVQRCARRSTISLPSAEMASYLDAIDAIVNASKALGMRSPTISFDEVREFFHVSVVKVLAWDRHGIVLQPQAGLGAIQIGLPAIPREQALADLARSDFAVLGADRERGAGDRLYPVNRSLQQWSRDLLAWASTNMIPIHDAEFFGRRVTVFARPSVACDVASGAWITGDGIRCRALGAALRRRPILEFRGTAYPRYLRGTPTARASVRVAGFASLTTPGSANLMASCDYRTGEERDAVQPYSVRCALCSVSIPDDSLTTIEVTFDRNFVPRAIGLNADERALVVQLSEAPQLEQPNGSECQTR